MKKILIIILSFTALNAFGQMENPKIRKGNKFFEQKNYSQAEGAYQKALKINPNSEIATYNIANAQYKQKNYKGALSHLEKMTQKVKSKDTLADIYYNTGNTYVRLAEDTLQKHSLQGAIKYLQSALDNYKASIKLNPDDKEAKFNYVITKKFLEKLKQQQNKQNKNKQNKNKQNKQNKNKQNKNKQNKNKQNKQNQKNKQQQQQNKDNKKQNKGQKQNAQQISYNDMMKLLKAVENGDMKTYQKAKNKMQKNVKSQDKNW